MIRSSRHESGVVERLGKLEFVTSERKLSKSIEQSFLKVISFLSKTGFFLFNSSWIESDVLRSTTSGAIV